MQSSFNPEDFYNQKEKKLDLTKNSLRHLNEQDIIEKVIPFLEKHPEIEMIDISFLKVGDKTLLALSKVNTLKALSANAIKITLEGIAAISSSPSIKFLSLGACNVDDVGAEIISQNQNLTQVELYGNQITDEGVKHLAKNPKIKKLGLSYNKFITDEAAIFLALSEVAVLDITGNEKMGNATAEALAQSKRLIGLRMAGTKVTSVGATAYPRTIPLKNLI